MRRLATVGLLVAVGASGLSAQTLREQVREFARENPNAVYRFPRAPADPAGPLTIEGIARKADVVLRGRLAKSDTRLIADQVVVTDYSIVDPMLIAGRLPVQQTSRPGAASTPLTLSVWGGKMLVDGVPVEAEGGYRIKEGSTYIVFLRPTRQSTLANNYEPYDDGLFEIDGTRVVPVAENIFSDIIDRNVNDFVRRIQNVVRIR